MARFGMILTLFSTQFSARYILYFFQSSPTPITTSFFSKPGCITCGTQSMFWKIVDLCISLTKWTRTKLKNSKIWTNNRDILKFKISNAIKIMSYRCMLQQGCYWPTICYSALPPTRYQNLDSLYSYYWRPFQYQIFLRLNHSSSQSSKYLAPSTICRSFHLSIETLDDQKQIFQLNDKVLLVRCLTDR